MSSTADENPEVILIATGSEVSLAVAAHEKLVAKAVSQVARRVDAELASLRKLQDAKRTRNRSCPGAIKARIAIEMGGRDRLGSLCRARRARPMTMATFGASAPIAKLQDKYGFTVENMS